MIHSITFGKYPKIPANSAWPTGSSFDFDDYRVNYKLNLYRLYVNIV